MTDSYIGQWLGRTGGKLHLIESEITDRLVTHCGRQMRLVLHGLAMRPMVEGGPAWQCGQCYAKAMR